jgi:ribonuclease Z
MGLLTTLSLLKRDKKLEIFCPVSVLRIVQAHIKHAKMKFSYELKLNGLKSEKSKKIFECPSYIVQTIPLKHSIFTNGFLIKEQPKKRKLLIDKLKDKKIDKIYYNKFTKGLNVIDEDGNEVSYLDVTKEGDNSKSYAYCSDTSFCESIIETIKGVDLLYCETTFLQRHQDKAISTFHSTTKDAGILAQKAEVKKLLIGHFSSRYDDIQEFFNETKEFFNDVML